MIASKVWNGYTIRFIEKDGEPWFVGKDIASILGYVKPLNALSMHVDEDDSLKQGLIDSMGRMQETILINESGLYSLILSSKLPAAKKFKRWVTRELIPQARKSAGLEAWEAFRMMDKEHQKKAMDIIHGFKEPTRVDYIKANTIANKAISIKHGYPKMIKKTKMSPEQLVERQQILDDTVELMKTNDKFNLGLSVSREIYKSVSDMNDALGGVEE